MTYPQHLYNMPARWLHWSMALLVLLMIPAGIVMTRDGISRPLQDALFVFHKNTGTLLLILIVVRIVYRWRHPPPPVPAHLPGWQVRIASANHLLLYALLVIMPVAGYIRVRAGGFPIEFLDAVGVPALIGKSKPVAEIAKTVHYYGAIVISALILLHIGAALHHALIRRDGIFARMWVWNR